MYAAKRAGRNRISVYIPGTEVSGTTQIDLEAELRRAIERGSLVLHHQPIVDTGSGRIVGLESLVRWPLPDGTLAQGFLIAPPAPAADIAALLLVGSVVLPTGVPSGR